MENQSTSQVPSTPTNNRSRTIVLDVARLIKKNKITQAELATLDKETRDQAISLASELPDEPETLSLKHKVINKEIHKDDPKKGAESLRQPSVVIPPVLPQKEILKPVVKKEVIKEVVKKEPKKEIPPVIEHKTEPKIAPKVEPKPIIEDNKILLERTNKEAMVLEKEIAILMQDKIIKNKEFQSLVKQAEDIEKEEERIKRNIEEISAFKDKKVLEEKRWALEEKRQAIEKSRFGVNVEIDQVDKKVLLKKSELEGVTKNKKDIELKIKKQDVLQNADKAKRELEKENVIYENLLTKKKEHEAIWLNLKKEIKILEQEFTAKETTLTDLKHKLEDLTTKEKMVTTEQARHNLEEERWAMEKSIREIETGMWQIETTLDGKNQSLGDLEKGFASIQIEQEQSIVRLAKYKNIIAEAN